MKIKMFLLCCLLLCGITKTANAITLIDNSTMGYYNSNLGAMLNGTNPYGGTFLFPNNNSDPNDPLINPAPEPDLSSASSILGDWLNDTGNLNSNWSSLQSIPSTWAVNSETAIVYEFDAGTGMENVQGLFGVDNGLFVWLDGTYISGALAPGGASQWEYTFLFSNLSAGTHYLQVLREDHGGSTGWAVNFSGDKVAPIPEPATMLLLGISLVGLAGFGRKKSKK
ncbi:MAG: PEP-CTERM sorting domain-containing protein [Desulfobacterales bacterium]|nr:PEP-CTERM sorting domain-containing protein [Desulfobacterales bacterium]